MRVEEAMPRWIDDRLEAALRGPNALQQLREIAQEMLDQGQDRASILALFEQTRQQLRDERREAEEDVVLEAMDFLAGWCSPHMRLSEPEP
jgi:hypothetical protein